MGMVEQALRLTPQPSKRYFFPLGRAYYLLGQAEEAIEPLQRVLRVYPHDLVNATCTVSSGLQRSGAENQEARAEAAEVLPAQSQI